MYYICKTELGDVAACLGEMLKTNINAPIVQVGMKLYKTMKKMMGEDAAALFRLCGTKKAKHVINKATATIHKDNCRVLTRTKNACKVGAYLVNPDTTGLKHCKVCM